MSHQTGRALIDTVCAEQTCTEHIARLECVHWLDTDGVHVVGVNDAREIMCVEVDDLVAFASAKDGADARLSTLRVHECGAEIEPGTRVCVSDRIVAFALRNGGVRAVHIDRLRRIDLPRVDVGVDDGCGFPTATVARQDRPALTADIHAAGADIRDLINRDYVERTTDFERIERLAADRDEEEEADAEFVAEVERATEACNKVVDRIVELNERVEKLRGRVNRSAEHAIAQRTAVNLVVSGRQVLVTRMSDFGTRIWTGTVDARSPDAVVTLRAHTGGFDGPDGMPVFVTDVVRCRTKISDGLLVTATPFTAAFKRRLRKWLKTESGKPPVPDDNSVFVAYITAEDLCTPRLLEKLRRACAVLTPEARDERRDGGYQPVPNMPDCLLAPFEGGATSVRATYVERLDATIVCVATPRQVGVLMWHCDENKVHSLAHLASMNEMDIGRPLAECAVSPCGHASATVFRDGTMRLLPVSVQDDSEAFVPATAVLDALRPSAASRTVAFVWNDAADMPWAMQLLPHGRVRFVGPGVDPLPSARRVPTDPLFAAAAAESSYHAQIINAAEMCGTDREAARKIAEGWVTGSVERGLTTEFDERAVDGLTNAIMSAGRSLTNMRAQQKASRV